MAKDMIMFIDCLNQEIFNSSNDTTNFDLFHRKHMKRANKQKLCFEIN